MQNEFIFDKAYYKLGTKQQDAKKNPLTTEDQLKLINTIIDNTYNISLDGKEKFVLNLGGGKVQFIERTYKNFLTNIAISYPAIYSDEFLTINLEKLFEVLKTRACYDYRESRSPFFKVSEFIIDQSRKTIINQVKIEFSHDLSGISEADYQEIVRDIQAHWDNKIDEILNYLVAGVYVTDKKNLWLLILAKSNFGKSKLFDWMRAWNGSSFIKFDDIVKNGISDKKPEEFENKICLVIDEVMHFARKLFEIEASLCIRPMRNHAIEVPINARVMLSADGGQFNDEHQDSQITNRVACIDFRERDTEELGNLPVSKKFGQNKIKRVMSHYLYVKVLTLLTEYNSHDKHLGADRAEKVINDFFIKYKMQKKNFFATVDECMQDILMSPVDSLGSKLYDEMKEFIICDALYKNKRGWIIKNPNSILDQLLIKHNKSLKYELEYKKVPQIVSQIDGWVIGAFKYCGKTVKGLFIPDKSRDSKDIVIEIVKPNGEKVIVDRDGNELF